MATTTKKPDVDPIQQWADEAAQKAEQAIIEGITLEIGDVSPRDPKLRYVVFDGNLPDANLSRHRSRLEHLGYRDVTDQIDRVVGYTSYVVYAIPVEVYRKVIRPERIRRLRTVVDRFGFQAPMVHRPAGPELT